MIWSVSCEGNSQGGKWCTYRKKRGRQFFHTMGCCFLLFVFGNLLFCFAPFQLKTIVPVTRKFRGWLSNEPECPAWTFVGSRDPTAKRLACDWGVLVSASWLGLMGFHEPGVGFCGIFEWSRRVHTHKMENWYLWGTIWHPFEGAGMQSL